MDQALDHAGGPDAIIRVAFFHRLAATHASDEVLNVLELRADAYEVRDNGKRVIFHGNVWSRFVAKTKQAPEGEANIVVEATE